MFNENDIIVHTTTAIIAKVSTAIPGAIVAYTCEGEPCAFDPRNVRLADAKEVAEFYSENGNFFRASDMEAFN